MVILGGFAASSAWADAASERQAKIQKFKDDAAAMYEAMGKAYMAGDWEELEELSKSYRRHLRWLDPTQRKLVMQMVRSYDEFRPKWWKATFASSDVKFPAEIWGRKFVASYEPSQALGFQAVRPEGRWVKNRQGEYEFQVSSLNVFVTWKPSLIDSPNPAVGKLAEKHDLKQGDIGEVIVWHELGHNYITVMLPVRHVVELYTRHELLFHHLQEYYADLSALYHASPRARRVQMWMRLEGLDYYAEDRQHTRAAHAIGAWFLAQVLERPKDWPSVHLPPAVPDEQIELNTIIYVYENWGKHWSLEEDIRFRDAVHDFVMRTGEKTLRSAGVVPLPNRQKFSLMAAHDRDFQKQRDRWVAQKLEQHIKSGRADKLEDGETYDPPRRQRTEIITVDPDKMRIELPW